MYRKQSFFKKNAKAYFLCLQILFIAKGGEGTVPSANSD